MHNQKSPSRFIFIFFSLIFLLLFFATKLVLMQIFRSSYLGGLADKQHNYFIKLEPKRGAIFDRHLRPLALNVPVFSLYANPRAMRSDDKARAVQELSTLLKMNPDTLRDRLNKKKYFVWLARKLPMSTAEEIKTLKIRGLDFIKETKRYYPNQSLAAHIIGFAGIDNQGLEGLELRYDKLLRGEAGWTQVLRDARQRELLLEKGFIPPKDGFNLVLTIDETIQYIAERAMDKAYEKHNAKGGMAVVMNPKTGEILALVNRPTFNPAKISSSGVEGHINRAVAYTYEPGSVFKIVAAAAALEEGVAKESDKFFCENGKYRLGSHILRDHHPHGTLTFTQVFEQSSNIGVCKIAQMLGPARFYEYAKKFRFGIETDIGLPGEVNGYLKSPSVWSKTSIGAIPMGQEVTVTTMQLVTAISVIANKGIYVKPFVVKAIKDNNNQIIQEFDPVLVDRVVSEQTAERVKNILVGVVENGTGKRAQVKGVKVAGKTGTAQKVVGGVYSHDKFYASFIGFAPADDPQLAIVVSFDEPHPSYFGGTVSAPVFQEIVENSLKYLKSFRTDHTR